jgi:hypothetical protein
MSGESCDREKEAESIKSNDHDESDGLMTGLEEELADGWGRRRSRRSDGSERKSMEKRI